MVITHNGEKENISKLVFAPVLKACSKAYARRPGEQIHAQTIKFGISSDIFIQTSLIAMYSSCGQLELSLNVFEKMAQRNVVTWTTMMDSYLKSEQPEMVLFVFREMQVSGVEPDHFAIVSLLTACSRLGVLSLGKWFDGEEERSLLECYVTWAFGEWAWEEALPLFLEMEMDGGVRPNDVTFVGVLCGCSHSGLVEEGRFYFDLMKRKYGIEPNVKHYGCMVDLLGRAGLVDEAFEMVTKMRVPPNAVVLGSLLSACRDQNNLKVAECVTQMIIEIGDDSVLGDTSHYVIMSNMYAQVGLKDKMAEARTKIGKKPKGWSWIENGGGVHQFSVGDASHPMWGKIREMLDEVVRKGGCQYGGKENLLDPHSEKVAVAYGLLSTKSPTPIKIVKNLRICQDCHETMKLISTMYKREIVIRDCTRFHRFMAGCCSCKDYW
ncbi:hypothetical protein IFM89_022995 [Coptis chinensis]|uniref:DYW domain-containing protein n=1 Tax=Coptis chinensis TaxID=261450 RepID=A0A835IDX1_9MAGN|nr:hypothetical protein IFM89_022995 [Coptis chinensis]